jgi:multiple sugar transport system substrate-binding protein
VKRAAALMLPLTLALGSCAKPQPRADLYLQRFFGECGAQYGAVTDVAKAEGECGIITVLINGFNQANPGMRVSQNVVAWPGYPQLTAQMAARDPPDLVTMHEGVIADYAAKGLLEPVEPYLKAAGIDPASFTEASAKGVTINGRIYALPWDTHGGLYHVNIKLFRQAGLINGDRPRLPRSPHEMLSQARQFKQRTGKPYLIQSLVGDPAGAARTLYTYLMAQDASIFPDPRHLRVNTPQGRQIAALFKQMTAEGLGTSNMDTPAAIAAFLNGEGGIYPTGTWMIGQFQTESETAGRPLYGAYGVYPFPRLWGHEASFVSGHSWVVPKRDRTPEQKAAIAQFFRYMAAHNNDWTRTGHLPAFKGLLTSPAFLALPHRSDIAPLARIGQPLPGTVQRQSAVEGIVGEEMAAAITGQKPIEKALGDAERRVDEFLGELN